MSLSQQSCFGYPTFGGGRGFGSHGGFGDTGWGGILLRCDSVFGVSCFLFLHPFSVSLFDAVFSFGGKDHSIIGRQRPKNSSLNNNPLAPFSSETALEVCVCCVQSAVPSQRTGLARTRLDNASGARRAQTWSRKAGHGQQTFAIYKWRLPLAAAREGMVAG
jgi:hypothetical protein